MSVSERIQIAKFVDSLKPVFARDNSNCTPAMYVKANRWFYMQGEYYFVHDVCDMEDGTILFDVTLKTLAVRKTMTIKSTAKCEYVDMK